ncbi:MAG TPA: hypothetical protein VI485_12710 [Vicinamibacterales bacterium]|nr:hypothetical protein [Vicinamibacterales bacterium]
MFDWLSSSAAQMTLLFASWSFLTGGLWKLFNGVEKVASAERRQRASEWLQNLDVQRPLNQLADGFVQAFDSVFGHQHFSARCFWLSCVASYLWTTVLTLLWFALRPDVWNDVDAGLRPRYVTIVVVVLVASTAVLNVLPDFISLLKTRYVIGVMRRCSSRAAIAILAADAIGCALLGWFGFLLGMLLLTGDIREAFHGATELLLMAITFTHGLDGYAIETPGAGVWFYSTFMASVWVWLYAASSLILRVAPSVGGFWKWVWSWVDVRNQPFMSLGVVSIFIITVLYVIAAPFVLFA